MVNPIVSISGIRGNGKPFYDRVQSLSQAMLQHFNPQKMVYARDTRHGEIQVADIIAAECHQAGIMLYDFGIAPTPSIELIGKRIGAHGACGTASHNAEHTKGVKLFTPDGILKASDLEAILRLEQTKKYKRLKKPVYSPISTLDLPKHPHYTNHPVLDHHINALIEFIGNETVEKIREREFHVVLDHVMGAGYLISRVMLQDVLGCIVHEVYKGSPSGNFPRVDPEPVPKNLVEFDCLLTSLSQRLTKRQRNKVIGFAFDPDADRVVYGTSEGAISEQYSIGVLLKYFIENFKVLGSNKERIFVTNFSSSILTEKIAQRYGWEFIRTPVGERNVLDEIHRQNAICGGEGNGGPIYSGLAPCRDGLLGMIVALAYVANIGDKNLGLNEVIREMPRINWVQLPSMPISKSQNHIIDRLSTAFSREGGYVISTCDGFYAGNCDALFTYRRSNTANYARVIADASSKKRLNEILMIAKPIVGF